MKSFLLFSLIVLVIEAIVVVQAYIEGAFFHA